MATRSIQYSASSIVLPPKPRGITVRGDRSSLIVGCHRRTLELPVTTMAPVGGGDNLSCASNALISASNRCGSILAGASRCADCAEISWEKAPVSRTTHDHNATRDGIEPLSAALMSQRFTGAVASKVREARASSGETRYRTSKARGLGPGVAPEEGPGRIEHGGAATRSRGHLRVTTRFGSTRTTM